MVKINMAIDYYCILPVLIYIGNHNTYHIIPDYSITSNQCYFCFLFYIFTIKWDSSNNC